MTFLIRRSTYNNSINCITVLYNQRLIVMEQLIPFKKWGGFVLKFWLANQFFYRSLFHWTKILQWFWCLKKQRRRHVQIKNFFKKLAGFTLTTTQNTELAIFLCLLIKNCISGMFQISSIFRNRGRFPRNTAVESSTFLLRLQFPIAWV